LHDAQFSAEIHHGHHAIRPCIGLHELCGRAAGLNLVGAAMDELSKNRIK